MAFVAMTCFASATTIPPKQYADKAQGPNDDLDPVITMEQIGNAGNSLQSYRLQIFASGRVIYHGLWRVKQLGQWESFIPPEQVKRIQDEFVKYKFWKIPEYFSGSNGYAWVFTMRDGEKIKTIRMGGQAPSALWLKSIEREVKSAAQRCPYGEPEDWCVRLEKNSDESIEIFLKRDVAKFMETYK